MENKESTPKQHTGRKRPVGIRPDGTRGPRREGDVSRRHRPSVNNRQEGTPNEENR